MSGVQGTLATRKRIAAKESSNPIIYEGATQGDLVHMFRMTNADVKARIAGLRPVGTRNGYDIWAVREAAERLVKPPGDQIERILKMHPNDLPKMLAKEFWAGQNQRLNYLERMGDLWSTAAVVDNVGDAFKTIRLSLLLLMDAVERESGLSGTQREIISRLVSTCLLEMQRKLVDGFNDRRQHTLGKSFAPSEDDPAEGL